MKMLRIAAIAALLFAGTSAHAQWQTPAHSVPIGEGGGVTGFGNAAPGTAGQPLTSNGASSDPTFQAVPNAGLATMPANTIKCNPTSSQAAVQDCTPMQGAELTLFKHATYTTVSQDCGASLALDGGNYAVVFNNASTYANPCTFSVRNLASETQSKTLTVSGVSTSPLYPGQTALISGNGSAWTVTVTGRWKINTTVRFYVRPDGNDVCDGLANAGFTSGTACAKFTGSTMANVVGSNVDINAAGGGSAILTWTCGSPPCTFTNIAQFPVIVGSSFVGGSPWIQGDCGNPTNVKLSASAPIGDAIQVTFPTGSGTVNICGFEVAGGANVSHGVYCSGAGQCNISGPMQWDAISSTPTAGWPAGCGITANSGAGIYLNATMFFTANIGAAICVVAGGHLENGSAITINTSNTPAWGSGFINIQDNGVATMQGVNYNGTGATGNRCLIQRGGTLFTQGGLGSLPGNVACSTGAGTVHDTAGDRGNAN